MNSTLTRCWETTNPIYVKYHDEEWGVPISDDNRLFEFLVLGGFQAGLNWEIVLMKRNELRRAFNNFNPRIVASFEKRDEERILANPKVIRNRAKISSAIYNAKLFLAIQEQFGSFHDFTQKFVHGRKITHAFTSLSEVPTESIQSRALSKALMERGFRYVGPRICYAFMQAVGMVNDHITSCFRYKQIQRINSAR